MIFECLFNNANHCVFDVTPSVHIHTGQAEKLDHDHRTHWYVVSKILDLRRISSPRTKLLAARCE